LIEAIQYRTNKWWQPKAGLILSSVYLSALIYQVSFVNVLKHFLPAVTTILGIGLFGHLLNDFFDRNADIKVGKDNILKKKSLFSVLFLFSVSLSMAFLPWLILPSTYISLYLLIVEFVLLILYAAPLFRLKERGFLALITDALYAYVIPFLLAFYTFSLLGTISSNIFWLYLSASLFLLLFGIYNLAIHQLHDYDNDINTQTNTWAIICTKSKAHYYTLRYLWTLNYLFFLVFAITLVLYNIEIAIMLILIWVLKLSSIVLKKSPFHYSNNNVFYLQIINFHFHLWLPYLILFVLSFYASSYILLIIVHYLLFNYSSVAWFYYKFVHLGIRRILSVILNYTVFYLRIILLFESKEKARREFQDEYQLAQNDLIARKEKINIVLANQNKNKYSETFIQQHISNIESNNIYVHYIYGGKFPFIHGKWGALTGAELFSEFNDFTAVLLDKDTLYHKKKALANFLLHNNIRLFFVEFGTVGVEVYEVCKELQIPLIVVFHGYDAHHINFSPKNNKNYHGLFEYATKIICVSKDIQRTLISCGASSNKLFYLPCAIDLNKFPYSDHSLNLPVFLAVGRFAETKSPHLTILAFNEVLKEIPYARLRMIGKDGGGELFEACHILVKALKIEDRVDFLGILPPEEVFKEMKNARIFLQHSVTTPLNEDKEGTPVSVMEAMACGLPVIATRHAGIAELIIHNENGFLVEEYDYLQMAKEMIRVCKDDMVISLIGKNASDSIRRNELIVNNSKILVELVEEYKLK
jgi:glycosyltransferase involved in cell wall biosynthesis